MREAVEGPVKETEQIRISSNLRDNEIYIRKQCENCADILVRPMRLGEDRKVDCLMVYIEVTVSNMMLDDSAIGKMINHFWKIPPEKIQEFLKNNSLGIADVQKLENMDEVFGAILSGNAVFFIDGYPLCPARGRSATTTPIPSDWRWRVRRSARPAPPSSAR